MIFTLLVYFCVKKFYTTFKFVNDYAFKESGFSVEKQEISRDFLNIVARM